MGLFGFGKKKEKEVVTEPCSCGGNCPCNAQEVVVMGKVAKKAELVELIQKARA